MMLRRRRMLRPMKMGPEGRAGRKGLIASLPMVIRGYRWKGEAEIWDKTEERVDRVQSAVVRRRRIE